MKILTTLLIIFSLTSCTTTKHINTFKPLHINDSECFPTLPIDIKREALKMDRESKITFINASNYYKEKITTICNIIKEHNRAHS